LITSRESQFPIPPERKVIGGSENSAVPWKKFVSQFPIPPERKVITSRGQAEKNALGKHNVSIPHSAGAEGHRFAC